MSPLNILNGQPSRPQLVPNAQCQTPRAPDPTSQAYLSQFESSLQAQDYTSIWSTQHVRSSSNTHVSNTLGRTRRRITVWEITFSPSSMKTVDTLFIQRLYCSCYSLSNMAGTEHTLHCHDEQKRQLHSTIWPVSCAPALVRRVVLSKACVQKPNHIISMHIYLTPAADVPATWCLQSQYAALTRCILTQGRKLCAVQQLDLPFCPQGLHLQGGNPVTK